jgi:peptidyl-prolyl cis-trans isomerase C
MKNIVMLGILCAAVALTGCGKDQDAKVLAKVNGAKITVGDFKRQIEELPPQMQQAVMTDPKARQDFLEDLIGIEVVLQEAKRQGLHKDAEFKKRQDMLQKELKRRIEEENKNELFGALLKKELTGKVAIPTDQEVRDYYAKHQKDIKTSAGKALSFKEAEPQLKSMLYQQRQREAYVALAKELKAKAKINIDEKAMGSLGAALSQPGTQQNLQMQSPAVPGEKKP